MKTSLRRALMYFATLWFTLYTAHGYQHPHPNHLPDDISCCIVDLKFNGNQLFVCEFGEAIDSRFKGYDALYGKDAMWKLVWQSLASSGRSLCYAGNILLDAVKPRFAYNTFQDLGGCVIADNQPETLPENALLIAHTLHGLPSALDELLAQQPTALLLGRATSSIVRSKSATNELFCCPLTKQFKPATVVAPKWYTPALATTILASIPDELLVIKPPAAATGDGILIIHRKQLNEKLKLILQDKTELGKHGDIRAHRYWSRDKSPTIVVEAFKASKPIEVNQKSYNATMRAVFTLSNLAGHMNIHHLGAYWKLPRKHLDAPGTLTELHKSEVSTDQPSSAPVDETDYAIVREQLNIVLPVLYERMLSKHCPNAGF